MTAIYLFITRLLTGEPVGLLPARARSLRGATFIEYMLLAAIAVVLFGVIGAALRGSFDGILTRISNALS